MNIRCLFNHDKQLLRLEYETWQKFYKGVGLPNSNYSVTKVYFKCERCGKVWSENFDGIFLKSDFNKE
jgi:hypothetical protein